MTEFIYDATLVGLDFSVYCNAKAIVLSVYGICDKFNLIVQEFVKTMLALDASHLSFTRLKSDLLRKYENWDFDPPYTHSIFQLRRAIQRPMYTPKEEFKALQNCTKEMFVTFVRQLCTTFFVESLYVGNEMVQNYVEWLRPSLSTFPVVTVSPLTVEAVRFPISNHIYRELGKDPINSAVIYSLQVCDESDFKLLTLLGLFVQLTQDQAFHKLRTEQQLGYIVFSNKLIWMNTGSYFVLVQSEKSAEALESYIESFLEHILVFLDEMSPSDYQSHVDAYVAKLLEKPKNLAELAELHWSYIASERYTFDALKKMADIAKAHQIQDIREFFLHYIHPSSSHARKFSAHYLSSNSEPAMVPNVTFIDNLTQWVSEQQKYDVPQGLLPACSNLSKFT
ncbi:Insulinase (Peptidase M16) [Coelomomyces lativittatus]|nr:Insulinase (Peptidase M16) [Coelomomyces lativittatus]